MWPSPRPLLAAAAALLAAMALAPTAARGADAPEAAGPLPAPEATPPAASGASRPSDVVARVDGAPVTRRELDEALGRLPEQYRSLGATPEGRRRVLDDIILTRLLFKRARAQGFDRDPKVQAQATAYAEQLAIVAMMRQVADRAGGAVSEAESRAYYDAHPDEFVKSQESVRASHILVESEAEATALREALLGGRDFAEAAKSASKDQASAARGGDLGFFTRGRMVPEFAEAAFALEKAGDLSPVVQTQFGYHVIKLTDRRAAERATFDEAKQQIETRLEEERREAAVEALVDQVRSAAKIEVDSSQLAD